MEVPLKSSKAKKVVFGLAIAWVVAAAASCALVYLGGQAMAEK